MVSRFQLLFVILMILVEAMPAGKTDNNLLPSIPLLFSPKGHIEKTKPAAEKIIKRRYGQLSGLCFSYVRFFPIFC